MAKEKFVVATIRNYLGGSGDQGTVLGQFRKIEFARRARPQMLEAAQKKGWTGRRGIFFKGELVEEI